MGSKAALKSTPPDLTPSLDAGGALTPALLEKIKTVFAATGALHVTNTGVTTAGDMSALLPALGFGREEQYSEGGRTAGVWQEKWAAPGLRRMDYYPPQFALLPNTEIQYRRDFPARVLLFCQTSAGTGGDIGIHDAKDVEAHLRASGTGAALLDKISAHGLTIETGFLDKNHPEKPNNYYQSWQERFGSDDRDAALASARALASEYDDCWWQEDSGYGILCARITIPGFIEHKGEKIMRFPRIAMTPPAIQNGFRKFPLGNGVEMTEEEKSLVKDAYAASRTGGATGAGDMILLDNIRYGHSRTPYEGPRAILVAMAGTKTI